MSKNMTELEINEAKKQIDAMSQYQMAKLWRFAPSEHPYFDSTKGDLAEYFKNKFFRERGGFTPEISKSIGWDPLDF